MNYSIIKDENEFKKFINILSDLDVGEQFYIALFARKKYDISRGLVSDKVQLARTTATKDRIFDKVKKMEVPLGTYKAKGVGVPENTIALYIQPNPRSMRKASIRTAKMILSNIEMERYQNPKSIALNAIQVSKSKTVFVDFDFDINNSNYEKHITDIANEATGNEKSFYIVKTRGGYHVLVKPELTTNKTWFKDMVKDSHIDQTGDLLLPVPGCVQGGYTPKIINL